METRQITETKIFKLILNPMRSNVEILTIVACSFEEQKLIDWYNSQMCEPYNDVGAPAFDCHGDTHTWHKCFEKGSNLEWYNPMDHNSGIRDEWIKADGVISAQTNFVFV